MWETRFGLKLTFRVADPISSFISTRIQRDNVVATFQSGTSCNDYVIDVAIRRVIFFTVWTLPTLEGICIETTTWLDWLLKWIPSWFLFFWWHVCLQPFPSCVCLRIQHTGGSVSPMRPREIHLEGDRGIETLQFRLLCPLSPCYAKHVK
jgi:hypothetical protein